MRVTEAFGGISESLYQQLAARRDIDNYSGRGEAKHFPSLCEALGSIPALPKHGSLSHNVGHYKHQRMEPGDRRLILNHINVHSYTHTDSYTNTHTPTHTHTHTNT